MSELQTQAACQLAERLRQRLGDVLSAPQEFRGEVTVTLADPNRIREVCHIAKHELGFDYLIDVTAVDHYGQEPRFEIVYELYGLEHGAHLRLKTRLSEDVGEIPSVSSVWRTADWHEREAYDLMGVRFTDHPNLKRILMWQGYPHYPLRKDFPLEGLPTDLPEMAFTQVAPLDGGPFVTVAGDLDSRAREPRRRNPEDRTDH